MKKDFFVFLGLALIIVFALAAYSFRARGMENVARSQSLASCVPKDFSGLMEPFQKVAIFEGRRIEIPELATDAKPQNVLGVSQEERWVEVDLSEQKLKAWDGSGLFLETAVSTGLPGTPTPIGEFRIWIKLRSTRMEGGEGRYYYNLPNVPYVMYFGNDTVASWKGYGLHGTYWHSDFGTRRSHGCVNLPTPIAERLYYWTSPVLSEGKSVVRASSENPGTRIVIHE